MVDLKPTLASYARVSYLRELHGDLDGAVSAMRRAVAAGGPAPETVASVQALLGGLELARGRLGAARAAYRAALAGVPALPAAHAGLARLAAARGDLPGAIAAWRRLTERLPLPEYVTGLGEAELAAGRRPAARRDLALLGAQERLLAAAGVNTDAELAIFEADHGSARRAVAARPPRLGGRAERALRRRARLGADARGPPGGRLALGAARAAPGQRRSAGPVPRGHERACRGARCGGPAGPAGGAGARVGRLAVAGRAGAGRAGG